LYVRPNTPFTRLSKRRANVFKIHVLIARRLLDVCSMFARSCKRYNVDYVWVMLICADCKLAISAPFPYHPPSNPVYLPGPWPPGNANVYTGYQWPDDARDSALAASFNHAPYHGSSFYPVRAAYPPVQTDIDCESGFPGSASEGPRNIKLKSEHRPAVGVC